MLTGHFIPSSQGDVFVTQFGNNSQIAQNTSIDHNVAILCLPSITEELNLSRAVVGKTAQMLSKKTPVFILDYFGTGDSCGEFEQATTAIWLDDIHTVCSWLKSQGFKKVIVWGIRFGALLALHAQSRIEQQLTLLQFVFWKPVTLGKQFAGQFLRIKQANAMMSKEDAKINWRQEILEGIETEVAGYKLNAAMLTSLEILQITPEVTPKAPVAWFELAAKDLTPITKKIIAQWPENKVTAQSIECPMFWQVPEVFSLPELSELTCKVIA